MKIYKPTNKLIIRILVLVGTKYLPEPWKRIPVCGSARQKLHVGGKERGRF